MAFRVSLRLKARAEKRSISESVGEAVVECDPFAEAAWHELRPILDAELQELPAKYRVPMILCYLEGRTYEQVAIELGCPKGTVAIRLLRAREMLKRRLVRRGLVAAAGVAAAQSILPGASAAVPPALATSTTTAAASIAGGATLASAASVGITTLVHDASRGWMQRRLNTVCAAAICVCLSGLGVSGGRMILVQHDRSTARPIAMTAAAQPVKPVDPVDAVKPAEPPTAVASAEPASKKPIQFATPGQPFCICTVTLSVDDLAPPKKNPIPTIDDLAPEDARAAHPSCRAYVLLSVPEDAFDTVRQTGSVVLRPKNVNNTVVVLVQAKRDSANCKSRSGLALRERLEDDLDWLHDAGSRPPFDEPPAIAKAQKRPARMIAVTNYRQFTLFSGMVRLVFLRPINHTRANL